MRIASTAVVLAVGGLLYACAVAIPADDEVQPRGVALVQRDTPEAKQDDSTTSRKKPRGRLPNYYGRLGLSDEQRQQVYDIQAKYRKQIAELEKQIIELRARRDAEIEAVLTPGQKARLKEILETVRKRASRRKKAAEASRKPAETP